MRGWLVGPLVLALSACAGEESMESAAPKPTPALVAAKPPAEAAPVPANVSAPAPAPASVPASAIPVLTGTLPGDRIPIFQAKVKRSGGGAPREETVDPRAAKGAVVFVVMSTRCPDCNSAAGALRRAEDAFMARGVDFVYLYPDRKEPAEEKVSWHAGKGFRAGQVLDAEAAIAKLLEVNKTPTALLVGAGGGILYRGAVFEAPEGGGAASHFLADALDEHLAGKTISVSSTEPVG